MSWYNDYWWLNYGVAISRKCHMQSRVHVLGLIKDILKDVSISTERKYILLYSKVNIWKCKWCKCSMVPQPEKDTTN